MLQEISKQQLFELGEILDQLEESDYARPLHVLENGTLGKHVRHILEFYNCLFTMDEGNTICYDNRKRNLLLEENVRFASDFIAGIADKLSRVELNKRLLLKVRYSGNEILLESSLFRELTYNIEHTVHHLAIIRIAVSTELRYVKVGADFGYAHSTVQHLKSQKNAG